MTQKTLFRRVLDSLIEGRTRQAQRFIDDYAKTHGAEAKRQG